MAGELFKALSGTDIVHVPHKASGDARTAVLGGHVQMMIDAITTTAQNVQAGKLRALGTTGKTRSKLMPGGAHHRRGRRAGLRDHHLAGRHGAGGHAQGHRRQAQRRDRQGGQPAGDQGGVGASRALTLSS